MKSQAFVIIAALVLAAAARADFTLLPNTSPSAPSPGVSQTTPESPVTPPLPLQPAAAIAAPENPQIKDAPPLKALIARGFGDQIPLYFAARQIVPPPFEVRFASSANQQALVTWQGGRQWPTVLRNALRPLGLSLSIHHRTVVIFIAEKD